MSHHYALILAGGSGTRFWPLSRNSKPKQLLTFDAKGSMLQQAIARISSFIPQERIIILTNQIQLDEVRLQAPQIPAENIIAEPARRDTAPAVALGIALIAKRDPKANMIIVPSDSLILDDCAFKSLASEALDLASQEPALITIGIKPTWPCPSYGYVECGERLDDKGLQFNCHKVQRFREKPSSEKAQEYLNQGNFTWNAGIFIWNVEHVRKELSEHTPQLADFITRLTENNDTPAFILDEFPKLTPISIDFALMEKTQNVLNFEANFDWDDVGSWISLSKYMPQDENNNACNSSTSSIDASGNIAYTTQGKRIALLGVDDLIIVDTEDAILIARKDRADDIKKIVDMLPPELT
ncbi:MAG: sugar phosphate nucleotidyltransferase [Akkermansia sp.]